MQALVITYHGSYYWTTPNDIYKPLCVFLPYYFEIVTHLLEQTYSSIDARCFHIHSVHLHLGSIIGTLHNLYTLQVNDEIEQCDYQINQYNDSGNLFQSYEYC